MPYCMIITTLPDRIAAQTIAKHLVKKNLAACAQLSEIESFYMWKEKVEQEPEIRLVIKTSVDCYDAVVAWITENHPYDVPQIVRVDIAAVSQKYGEWLNEVLAG